MKKSDLKDGDVVEYNNGHRRIKVGNYLLSFNGDSLSTGSNLNHFEDDLHYNNKDLTIFKVLRFLGGRGFIEIFNRNTNIEITCLVNGKQVKLSDISEETLLKIRESERYT